MCPETDSKLIVDKTEAVSLWRDGYKAISWPEESPSMELLLDHIDPQQLFSVYTCLSLKPGWELHSIVCNAADSNGRVFAVREGYDLDSFIEEANRKQLEAQNYDPMRYLVLPEDVVMDIATVIQGDGSLLSYFHASLFLRMARELGARWHGVHWGHCHMLPVNPHKKKPSPAEQAIFDAINKRSVFNVASVMPITKARRTSLKPVIPEDWRPTITRDGGKVVVTFILYTEAGQTCVVRFTDEYNDGSYVIMTQQSEHLLIGNQSVCY